MDSARSDSVSIRDSIATAATRGSEVLDLERQGRGCVTQPTAVCQFRLLSVQDQNERPPQNLLTSGRRNGVHDTERCQSDTLRVGRSPMMHAAVVGQHKLESGGRRRQRSVLRFVMLSFLLHQSFLHEAPSTSHGGTPERACRSFEPRVTQKHSQLKLCLLHLSFVLSCVGSRVVCFAEGG